MGAVLAESGVRPKPEDLATRATELGIEMTRPEAKTGSRRRFTQDIANAFMERHDTVREMPAPSGKPSEAPTSGTQRKSREPRAAIRVDEVVSKKAKKITLRDHVEATPRIVNREAIARAPLDARDGFFLQLIDGKMSTTELVDASGFSEADVDAILARLARLGIVTY